MTKRRLSVKSGNLSRKRRKVKQRQSIRWLWIGVGGIIILTLAGVILLVNGNPSKQIEEISATQAYNKYQHGALFLDVRGTDEWNQAHIPNSISIPLDELASRLVELPRDKEIVVVCLLGKRSREGAIILVEAGFSNVSCLIGGLEAWNAGGFLLERKDP